VVRWLSPFFYFDQGHALAEGTTFQPLYAAALVAATVATFATAAVIFSRREVKIPLHGGERREGASHELIPYPTHLTLTIIYELRWTILGWTAGVAALGALGTVSLNAMIQNFGGSQPIEDYIGALSGGAQFSSGFLNFAVFVICATLVSTLAINVIGRFAADQEERRVEVILAQPITAMRLHLARAAGLVIASAVPALALLVAVEAAATLSRTDLGRAHLWSATFMVVPLALAVGMLGLAMLPRFSHQAVAVLSAVMGLSIVVTLLGGASGLNLPVWLTSLTLLRAYGTPAISGIDSAGLSVLLGMVALGAIATVLQARGEMGSG
jgi:hypothetical protein